MQVPDYNNLQEALTEKMEEIRQVPGGAKSVKAMVAEKFSKLKEEGKLDWLEADEVELLAAYRQWKVTSDAVTGVFHYKVKK